MLKNSYFPYAFFNHKVVKTDTAKVSIMTNALQYGTGVFGGLRGYYQTSSNTTHVFRAPDHFNRLLNSPRILGVSLPYSQTQLLDILGKLVRKNKPHVNCYFRPFAYADSLYLAPNLARDSKFNFAMYMVPLNDYLSTDKGLSVIVSSFSRISDTAIPSRGKISGAYINSALARKEASDNGYDEAIMLTQTGHVAEGSAENLFIVRDNQLITPPVSDDILEGITRKTIINLAHDQNIEVIERSIDKTELYLADEAFFTGTGVQLAWIASVDNRQIGHGTIGPITSSLQKTYFNVVNGRNPKYSRWITAFKIR